MVLTQQDVAAFDQVKATVAALRAEYDTVCANIVATEIRIKELPLLPVPPADLKAAILDMVDADGDGFRNVIKKHIKEIATNEKSGFNVGTTDFSLVGKPLRFADLNANISSSQILLTGGNANFVDMALFAIVGSLVKDALTAVMAEMTDDELGYASLKPDQIGTDRATRRAAIQAAQDQLTTLRASKATLAGNLFQLGIIVKG